MSLQTVAEHLASQGRGPDTTLVHMTPGEVSGLQALAKANGSSLTINPQTGLPEAGILSSLLPALAGIALGATGIGAPMAAAIVGGGTGLATGSLQKGLMAGLGAFGGAGMGAAMGGMGEAAMGAAGSAAASAPTAVNPQMGLGLNEVMGAEELMAQPLAAPWEAGYQAAPAATQAAQAAQGSNAAGWWDKLKAGGAKMMQPGGFDDFIARQKGSALSNAGMAFGPSLMGAMSEQAKKKDGEGEDDAMIRPYRYDRRSGTYTALPMYSAGSAGTRFMADGGDVDASSSAQMTGDSKAAFDYLYGRGAYPKQTVAETVARPYSEAVMGIPWVPSPSPDPMQAAREAAAAGLPGLLGHSDWTWGADTGATESFGLSDDGANGPGGVGFAQAAGGVVPRLLRGPGDGVSDSIPATINGQQPARLADGEFVIPARIVSELGNGSTEAGARQLYAMMDRVQQRRAKTTGKDRVAVDSNARKALPA